MRLTEFLITDFSPSPLSHLETYQLFSFPLTLINSLEILSDNSAAVAESAAAAAAAAAVHTTHYLLTLLDSEKQQLKAVAMK